MSTIKAIWTLVSRSSALARSSHSLVTKESKIFIHGGELQPRTPIDTQPQLIGALHTLDLKSDHTPWQIISCEQSSSTKDDNVPAPRVGAAACELGGFLYLWGGRGGKDMAPLAGEQTGMWRAALNQTYVHWEYLNPVLEGQYIPEARSFHTMTAGPNNKIYIHAGCPAKGRLSTLDAFDPATCKFTSLSPAPSPARGGTSLIPVVLDSKNFLIRFGGFSGTQNSSLDLYDIQSDKWHTIESKEAWPGARSVHGFIPYSNPQILPHAIALLFYGEKNASTMGHEGAGQFWDDVWLLSYQDREFTWKEIQTKGIDRNKKPEARGWFASAPVWKNGETAAAVMHGGLFASNERADDLWVLNLSLE